MTNLLIIIFTVLIALVGYKSATPTTAKSSAVIDSVIKTPYQNLTVAQYENLIKSDSIVLVDFNATWCGPCKSIAIQIELLQKELPGRFTVIMIDIDKNPALRYAFNLDEIPFLKIYKKGKLVNNLIGMMNKEALKKSIFNN